MNLITTRQGSNRNAEIGDNNSNNDNGKEVEQSQVQQSNINGNLTTQQQQHMTVHSAPLNVVNKNIATPLNQNDLLNRKNKENYNFGGQNTGSMQNSGQSFGQSSPNFSQNQGTQIQANQNFSQNQNFGQNNQNFIQTQGSQNFSQVHQNLAHNQNFTQNQIIGQSNQNFSHGVVNQNNGTATNGNQNLGSQNFGTPLVHQNAVNEIKTPNGFKQQNVDSSNSLTVPSYQVKLNSKALF